MIAAGRGHRLWHLWLALGSLAHIEQAAARRAIPLRREAIAAVARRHGVLIIEGGVYGALGDAPAVASMFPAPAGMNLCGPAAAFVRKANE